ncbi:hypothetical protein LTR28_004003, partial [Elasticomyces elasticus]
AYEKQFRGDWPYDNHVLWHKPVQSTTHWWYVSAWQRGGWGAQKYLCLPDSSTETSLVWSDVFPPRNLRSKDQSSGCDRLRSILRLKDTATEFTVLRFRKCMGLDGCIRLQFTVLEQPTVDGWIVCSILTRAWRRTWYRNRTTREIVPWREIEEDAALPDLQSDVEEYFEAHPERVVLELLSLFFRCLAHGRRMGHWRYVFLSEGTRYFRLRSHWWLRNASN